ncbi:MAG: thioesterase family protein [Gallionella sp.]
MIYVFVLSRFRPRITADNMVSELSLRVLPNDLDVNLHMNNGRYLTICDLNRVDLFIRSGLMKAMFKRGWIPVIAEHTMSYKRPLNLLQRYEVKLQVTHYDEKYFHMQHAFIRAGRVVAEGTSKGCVYAKNHGVVSPAEAMAAIESDRKNAK